MRREVGSADSREALPLGEASPPPGFTRESLTILWLSQLQQKNFMPILHCYTSPTLCFLSPTLEFYFALETELLCMYAIRRVSLQELDK